MPPLGHKKVKIVLKCEFCPYNTTRKTAFDDHVRVHTGERPFRCKVCTKGFTQRSNLGKHLMTHGIGRKKHISCDLCPFTTLYKQSLEIHMRWHRGEKPYKCSKCDKTFTQSTHRRTHMREAHSDQRSFTCDLCKKSFKRHDHLKRHMIFHNKDRKFECDICHQFYLEETYLKIHKRIHEGEASKKFGCDKCLYRTRFAQALRIHKITHSNTRPFKCGKCQKAFLTPQNLNMHMRARHLGPKGKIYKCEICNHATALKATLRAHIENKHIGLRERCVHCGKKMMKSSLPKHKLICHPIVRCKESEIKTEVASLKEVASQNDKDSSSHNGHLASDLSSDNHSHNASHSHMAGPNTSKMSANHNVSSLKRTTKFSKISPNHNVSYVKKTAKFFNGPIKKKKPPEKNPHPFKQPKNMNGESSMFQPVVKLERISEDDYVKEVGIGITVTDKEKEKSWTVKGNVFGISWQSASQSKKNAGTKGIFSSGQIKIQLKKTPVKLSNRKSSTSKMRKTVVPNITHEKFSTAVHASQPFVYTDIVEEPFPQPVDFGERPFEETEEPHHTVVRNTETNHAFNSGPQISKPERRPVSSFGSLRELAQRFTPLNEESVLPQPVKKEVSPITLSSDEESEIKETETNTINEETNKEDLDYIVVVANY